MKLATSSCRCGNVTVIGPAGWTHHLWCWNCPKQADQPPKLRLVKG